MIAKTDEELFARFRDTGCRASLAELFERYNQSLIRYGVNLGLSHADAQDIAQRIWMDVLVQFGRFAGNIRSVRNVLINAVWIGYDAVRVAHGRDYDKHRRIWLRDRWTQHSLTKRDNQPSRNSKLLEQVNRVLDRRPAERVDLLMRWCSDREQLSDIAQEIGVTEKQLRDAIHREIRFVRQSLNVTARVRPQCRLKSLKPWTEDEIAMLGTDTDAKVAAKLNRSYKSVTNKRLGLRIPPLHPRRKQ